MPTITSVSGSVTSLHWLLPLAVVGASAIVGLRVGHGPVGVLVAISSAGVALVLHVVTHEAGHLVVALVLRVRVVRVRISLAGGPNRVELAPPPSAALLPLRMVLVILGGPTADIALAGWAYDIAAPPAPTLMRCTLLAAALTGAAAGLINLVSFRTRHGTHSDGANILRWSFHPAQSRANLRFAQQRKAIEDGRVDQTALRAMLDEEPDHRLVLTAVAALWRTGAAKDPEQLLACAERLADMARSNSTEPELAAIIGYTLANLFGLSYLASAIVAGNLQSERDAEEIVEMAELAFGRLPQRVEARIALAVARLLQHRPAAARDVLLGIGPNTSQRKLHADAMVVRAVAETYLDDPAQADRLTRAAAHDGCSPELLQMTEAVRAATKTGALPPLSRLPQLNDRFKG